MASPLDGFKLPSQMGTGSTPPTSYSSPFASLDMGQFRESSRLQQVAAGTNVPDVKDTNGLHAALSGLDKFNPIDQSRVIQRAAQAGLIDRQKAGKAVRQILDKAHSQEAPVAPLTPLETAGSAVDNLGMGLLQPFKDVGDKAMSRFKYLTGPTSTPGQRQTIINNQNKAAQNPDYVKLVRSYGAGLPSHAAVTANQMATSGAKLSDIKSYLDQQVKALRDNNVKGLGDAAQISSYALGGPEAKSLFQGGKIALSSGLKMFGIGALGGEGATLADNPNASMQDQLKGAAFGGATGLVPFAGSALFGKGAGMLRDLRINKLVGKEAQSLLDKVGSAKNLGDLYNAAIEARSTGARALTKDEKNVISLVTNQKLNFGGDANDAFKALSTGDTKTLRGAFDTRPGADRFISGLLDHIAKGGYDQLKYSNVGQQIRRALGDNMNPVYDAIQRSDASFAEKKMLKEVIDFNSGNVKRNVASKELLSAEPVKQLTEDLHTKGFQSKKLYDDVSQYITARHENMLMDQKVKPENGALRKQNDAVISRYTPEQQKVLEGKYQNLKDVNTHWLNTMKNEGLLTPEQHAALSKNPDYIRVQRQLAQDAPEAITKGSGSINATTHDLLQKTGKSQDQMLDPLAVMHQRAHQIGQVIDKNRAASNILPHLESLGVAKNIRNVEDVKARQEIFRFLSDTRPGKMAVNNLLKTRSRELNRLQSEFDRLNRKGLNISLGKTAEDVAKPILSGNREVLAGARKMTDPMRDIPKLQGTSVTRQFSRSMTADETRHMVQSLVASDPAELNKVRTMIENRVPKLKGLFDDVQQLRDELQGFNTARGDAFGQLKDHADQTAKYAQNVAGNMVDGIAQKWELPTPVAEALKNQHMETLGKIQQLFGGPTHLFKTLTTQLNPSFGGPNIFRDIQDALAYARTHGVSTVKFMGGMGDSLANTLANAFGLKTGKDFQSFARSEGEATFMNLQEGKGLKAARKDIINSSREDSGSHIRYIQAKYFSHPLKALETYSNMSEQYTRYASYKSALDAARSEGMTEAAAHQKAILASRNNSIDFYKGGSAMSPLNTFIPYLNPAIQGARQFAKTMRENPASFTAKILTQAGMPIVMSTLWNLHDENTRKIYMDIPESEKNSNFIFIIPGMTKDGRGRYPTVKIPMPYGISSFVQPLRRVIEAAAHVNTPQYGQIATDLLSPFSGVSLDPQQAISQTALGYPAIKGVAQAMSNRDFYFGKDIVPGSLQGAPAAEQFTAGTSNVAKELGAATNTSPMKIEQFARDTLGGGAPILFNAADQIQSHLVPGSPAPSGKSVPQAIADRFGSAQGGEVERQFYNVYGPAKGLKDYRYNQIQKLLHSGDGAKIRQAQRMANDYNHEVDQRFGGYFKQYGHYLQGNLSNGANPIDMIRGLKIDVQTSHKGSVYVKR